MVDAWMHWAFHRQTGQYMLDWCKRNNVRLEHFMFHMKMQFMVDKNRGMCYSHNIIVQNQCAEVVRQRNLTESRRLV